MSQPHEFNPHFLSPEQHQQQLQQATSRHRHGNKFMQPTKTNPIAWLLAILCSIFSVVIIVGGLAILIIYLAFRPRSPQFNIQNASLNAAYLNTGNLLNADLTILANFSNPNKKVEVDISYTVIDLYYGNTLIATNTIGSFSSTRTKSKLRDIHMVSSEVNIPMNDVQHLRKQFEENSVTLYVKGLFRGRSRLRNFFHYSYWLHSRCTIVLTSPPSGVLVSTKCRTKR